MDQSRSYWNQKEQSTCLNSHVLSMLGCSWEEQAFAFAEDAAGPLGGCIWPPRSYTCSFCRREFRSAQALGGHMNVHRRDRARLKKFSSSTSDPNPNPNPNSNSSSYHKMNQVIELDPPTTTTSDICLLQNPSKICNPSFDLDHNLSLNSSSSCSMSNSVSILRPFTCSFDLELPQKRFRIDHLGNQDKGITIGTKVLELTSTTLNNSNEQSKVHLASDFNSLVRKRSFDGETPIFNTNDDVREGLIFKKRRIEGGAGYSFLKRKNNLQLDAVRDGDGDEDDAVMPVERSKNSRLESLDLELRLGDPRS